ncbi:MAG: hypothetical protein ACOCXJ_06930 [Planctomycetota bacterium]
MNDNVIQFPGSDEDGEPTERAAQVSSAGDGSTGIPGLTIDQEKAIRIAVDGMSFVMVGIKPTESGADFFTAVHGLAGTLQDAGPHLDGVIQRALQRMGLAGD